MSQVPYGNPIETEGADAPTRVFSGDSPNDWRVDVNKIAFVDGLVAKVPAVQKKENLKKVKRFYKHQNELVDAFVRLNTAQQASKFAGADLSGKFPLGAPDGDDEKTATSVRIAVRGSLAANIFLLCIKIVAAAMSGSLSVIASVLDSALDLFSGAVLAFTDHFMSIEDNTKYPAGKKRFEPLGVLIFSCVMCVASVSVLQEGAVRFASGKYESVSGFYETVGILALVILIKLVLYFYCKKLASFDASCDALAQDHCNDCLSNALGILGVVLNVYVAGYWDPIFGCVITAHIMQTWARTGYAQLYLLSGHMGPTDILNQLTFLAMNHHHAVIGVDTVRAFTSGGGYVVEIDLVVPPEMLIREAHDIGESLQLFLENQDIIEVTRAYVHLDYETTHSSSDHR